MSNYSYLRPLCAIFAGVIADRISTKKISIIMFLLASISSLSYVFILNLSVTHMIIITNISISMIAFFSLRGIYFSLLRENLIPTKFTGFSVGIISLVGFLPDVYVGSLFGYYLDNFEIQSAFQICFSFIFFILCIGLIASLYLKKKI